MRFTSIGEVCRPNECGAGGLVVKGRFGYQRPVGDAWIKETLSELIRTVAENCMDLGVRTIGHIQARGESQAGRIHADTIGTAQGVHVQGSLPYPVSILKIRVHSVMPGFCKYLVKAATLEGIYTTAEKYGFFFHQDTEQVYFEEFDALDLEMGG